MNNVNQHTPHTEPLHPAPSAARIAELIAPASARCDFERGWFWTAAPSAHESEQDTLAFRQRPDGDGIDVRCKSAGCRRERMIKRSGDAQRRVDLVPGLRRPLPTPRTGSETADEALTRRASDSNQSPRAQLERHPPDVRAAAAGPRRWRSASTCRSSPSTPSVSGWGGLGSFAASSSSRRGALAKAARKR